MREFWTILAAFAGGVAGGGTGVVIASLTKWAEFRKDRIDYQRGRIWDARMGLANWRGEYAERLRHATATRLSIDAHRAWNTRREFQYQPWYLTCEKYLSVEDKERIESFAADGITPEPDPIPDQVVKALSGAIDALEEAWGVAPKPPKWWRP